ncbi:MAG: AAA family ATPase, partial [Leptospiraceae bacterium]|nr:AAA family ATPase [Leptospiraceae bacterium]
MRITESLESALGSAHDLALNSHHEFITPEHILMSLLDDETTRNALVAVGCDTELLAADLTDFFNTEMHSYPDSEVTPEYSEQAQFLLEFSAMHVQMSGKEELSGLHILAAIFRLGESNAVYFLEKQNITRFDIVRYISHGIGKNKEANTESASTSTNSENDPLKAYCIDLTQKARDGEIDPMIGRDRELERVIHILARRRKNNPVLVGDAGVGKTSIIEGLATAIVEEKVPQFLLKKTIMTLNMAALMGGTRFRGDFEERMDALLKKLEDNTDVILFIDEIHTIIGAGAASGGSLDASNLLKPALANGRLRCVGATTWKEYNMIFEKDMALSRRFQKVEVNEPDEEDAYKILDGLKPRYEKFHSVQYAPASLRSAVALSRRYISDRRLPDKAIDLMDEAGAGARVAGQLNRRITSTDMEKLISRITGIPTSSMKTSEKKAILNLEEQLKKRIFGQDAAITAVSAALETSRAGLQSPDKPDGVFLFAGPTGTGKTELSKSLAEILGIEFIRFDMSEYMERHAVSRLIGSPPGYIGYEQGG